VLIFFFPYIELYSLYFVAQSEVFFCCKPTSFAGDSLCNKEKKSQKKNQAQFFRFWILVGRESSLEERGTGEGGGGGEESISHECMYR